MRQGFIALSLLCCGIASGAASPVLAADTAPVCAYRIAVRDLAVSWMDVTIRCPAARPILLRGWRSIPHDHVRNIRGLEGTAVTKVGRGWQARPAKGAVVIRYGFDIADLTRSTGSPDIARWIGKSLLTSVSSFLLVPDLPDATLDLDFRLPTGLAVASALAQRQGISRIAVRDVAYAGYMVFGGFRRLSFELPFAARAVGPKTSRARVTVALLDSPLDMGQAAARVWLDGAFRAVAEYFHGFPVDRALVVVWPRKGRDGLLRGVVVGGGGATMLLQIGQHAKPSRVAREWMLIHELAHFGFPHVADRRRWLSEGMAVYLETVIRARRGWAGREETWFDLIGFLGSGLPALEGGGLDGSRSNSGTYAGGALFMLLADIGIRRATAGRASLGTCLRGILRAGGDVTQRWTSARIIARCDKETGMPVAAGLTARFAVRGTPVDYPALWAGLGIRKDGQRVVYDDTAPHAAIRRAILAPR